MKVLVTGAAGFIGSRLCGSLLDQGFTVAGVDCLTDYYDPTIKIDNIAVLLKRKRFSISYEDLVFTEIPMLLRDVSIVFHLAGQPGVRDSWRYQFPLYVERNIIATHRLLEASSEVNLERFVYSSSSSVYGQASQQPTRESTTPMPESPYGVTKLAAEHMCGVYAHARGIPSISLRYFTVFGGGQRPDMALHRMIQSAYSGEQFEVYGDGDQRRDFTHVLDVVRANILAGLSDVPPGTCMNIAGGVSASVNELLELVERLSGRAVPTAMRPKAAGDVRTTSADTAFARDALGWSPAVGLFDGVGEQIEWARARVTSD